MGVGLSAMFAAAEDPQADLVSLVDDGLAQLRRPGSRRPSG